MKKRDIAEKNFASRYVLMKVLADERINFKVDWMSVRMELVDHDLAIDFKLVGKNTKITAATKNAKKKLDNVKNTLSKSGVGEGSLWLGFREITNYLVQGTHLETIGRAALKECVL